MIDKASTQGGREEERERGRKGREGGEEEESVGEVNASLINQRMMTVIVGLRRISTSLSLLLLRRLFVVVMEVPSMIEE